MKLSVCIPVYNAAPYIERCARSLFEQTYREMEYVFVDDCSPDDSMHVLQRVLGDYPGRKPQTKLIRREANGGVVAARKAAMAAATGDLIVHCDPDDWVDVGLYGRMVERLVETNADAVMCQALFESGSSSVLRGRKTTFLLSGPDALCNLENIPGLSSLVLRMARREMLDLSGFEWPDSLMVGEDLCLSMQFLARCRLLTNVIGPEVYHYRCNPNSISHSSRIENILKDHRQIFDILSRTIPESWNGPVRRYVVRTVLYLGVTQGLLSADEIGRWRSVYESLGGSWNWSDKSLWGQRMMRLANANLGLSRLVAPLVKGRIHDCL